MKKQRGRPPKKKAEKATARIMVNLQPLALRYVKLAAESQGLKLQDFCRRAIMHAAGMEDS